MREEEQIINSKRTRCEVYSRVVGYLRPTSQYNPGMKQQFHDRKMYKLSGDAETRTIADVPKDGTT
jgi:anaerobic ribonucleoside-triphosphate reductase